MTAPASYPLLWGSDATHPDTRAVCDGAMTQGVAAQGVVPNASLKTDQVNEQLRLLSLWAVFAAGEQGFGHFGDASDGNVTLATGTTTVLARDMYYDVLTVEGTAEIVSAGFRIYARRIVGTDAASVFSADGTAGHDGSTGSGLGGAGSAQGSVGGGGGGADANDGSAGATPSTPSPAIGGAGGDGGDHGGNAGGTGAAVAYAASLGGYRHAVPSFGLTPAGVQISGGSGGCSGGSNSANFPGAGGGGGGVLVIYAEEIDFAGTFQANGGAGGAGQTDTAGGGGGGPGAVLLHYRRATNLGTREAAGGAGGAGAGGAQDGDAGAAAGLVLEHVI